MSFINKNRIKFLLTIFFVVISVFGNAKNVSAQVQSASIDRAKAQLTSYQEDLRKKEEIVTSFKKEIADWKAEGDSIDIETNPEEWDKHIAKGRTNNLEGKGKEVEKLGADIKNINASIRYAQAVVAGASPEELARIKAETATAGATIMEKEGEGWFDYFVGPVADFFGPVADFVGPVANFVVPVADFVGPVADFVSPDGDACDFGKTGLGIFTPPCLRWLFAMALDTVVRTLSAFTYLAAGLFTIVIQNSINFIKSFGELQAVTDAWKILRDLANMFALLIMMYIAIGTILDTIGGNWKKMIGELIIAVILINFSMAITGLIIDTSNVFAVYFYDKARGGEDGNISTSLINKLSIAQQTENGLFAVTDNLPKTAVPSIGAIILNSILTLVDLICLFFILIFASCLFMVRIVSLIFALIMSPLPWLGKMMPKYGEMVSGDYWKDLLNQAFFAPAFMLCLYISMSLISCGNVLLNTINGNNAEIGGVFLPFIGGTLNTVFFHALVISLLAGTIIISRKMSAAGAAGAEKVASAATGLVTEQISSRVAPVLKRAGTAIDNREFGGRISGAAQWVSGTEAYKRLDKELGGKITSTVENPMGSLSQLLKAGTKADILPPPKSKKETMAEQRLQDVEDAKKDLVTLSAVNRTGMTTVQQDAHRDSIKHSLGLLKDDDFLEAIESNPSILSGPGGVPDWMSEDQLKVLTDHKNRARLATIETNLGVAPGSLEDTLIDRMALNSRNPKGFEYAEMKSASRRLKLATNTPAQVTAILNSISSPEQLKKLNDGDLCSTVPDLANGVAGTLRPGVIDALGPAELQALAQKSGALRALIGQGVRARINNVIQDPSNPIVRDLAGNIVRGPYENDPEDPTKLRIVNEEIRELNKYINGLANGVF